MAIQIYYYPKNIASTRTRVYRPNRPDRINGENSLELITEPRLPTNYSSMRQEHISAYFQIIVWLFSRHFGLPLSKTSPLGNYKPQATYLFCIRNIPNTLFLLFFLFLSFSLLLLLLHHLMFRQLLTNTFHQRRIIFSIITLSRYESILAH
jgi:hypothetical protein